MSYIIRCGSAPTTTTLITVSVWTFVVGLIKTLSYFNYFCCRSAEEPRRSWRSATPTHDDLGGHQPPPTAILEVINPHPRRSWRSSTPTHDDFGGHQPPPTTILEVVTPPPKTILRSRPTSSHISLVIKYFNLCVFEGSSFVCSYVHTGQKSSL